MKATDFAHRLLTTILLSLLYASATIAAAQTDEFQQNPAAGPNNVVVHSKFGGQIFGFDIDQNGTEGVLAESLILSNGNFEAAVETFDQKTGKILNVITKTTNQDDFIALGVVGTSTGLFEHEHEVSFLHLQRTFSTINPLSGNKVTGTWTPPIGTTHLLSAVSRNQGSTNNAVFAQDNSSSFIPWVFSSNIAANTFGPVVKIDDSFNFGTGVPPMAYNSVTNQAVIGGGNGCFGCSPVIGIVDLTKGTLTEFTGAGFGFINGIAVDSADNIACTTTEDDGSVEFYNLTTHTATAVVILPGSGAQQIFSGADVEFDATHKLFLVAQPVSSSSSGSSIYVYDTKGNLQETLNGFSFSNASNVVPAHIALKPSTRTGFVDGPSSNVNELQGFTY